MNTPATASSLPPEAIALAGRMYDAARQGDVAIFQRDLPVGLPANLTNDKGDTLVCVEDAMRGNTMQDRALQGS